MTPAAGSRLCRRRTTIAQAAVVRGVGIHTGAEVTATLLPADRLGAGVVFRVPGSGGTPQEIPARPSNVSETTRCTVLSAGSASIATVEHLLSAFAGLGVTDALVEVDGPELPIGDGSALPWVEAIAQVGIREVDAEAGDPSPLVLTGPVLLAGKGGAFIAGFPAETLRITVAVAFDHPLVGTQVARFEPERGDRYEAAVAPARTFGFIEEVEALRAAGLARGGSFDNAVVVYPDRYSSPLRFENELARHKLLDVLGDLSLVGRPLAMDVVAVKPSHRLNTDFARQLASAAAARGAGSA